MLTDSAVFCRILDQKHRLIQVINGVKIPTVTIPIKYIIQAEGASRPRGLSQAHADDIAQAMWWEPNVGQGSPALVCVDPKEGDETTVDPAKFVWSDIPLGRYLFICFGHQHLLCAKNICVTQDQKVNPKEEDQCPVFKEMECRPFINLSPADMVLVRTSAFIVKFCLSHAYCITDAKFLRAIVRTQLGNEQNNIDAYMQSRGQTELALCFRREVEMAMTDVEKRKTKRTGDDGETIYVDTAPTFPVFKSVPDKKKIGSAVEEWLKEHSYRNSSVDFTPLNRNKYSVIWNCAMLSSEVWDQLVRGMHLKRLAIPFLPLFNMYAQASSHSKRAEPLPACASVVQASAHFRMSGALARLRLRVPSPGVRSF